MTTTETLVDCHFHVFDAGVAVASARYRPPYDAPLEGWLSMAGTVRGPAADPYGVVVQTSFLGTDNSAMLAALRRMPERLRGVAVVDPSAPPAELAALDAAGVRGIRLNLYGDAGWRRIDTTPWRTLFQRIAALGWHIEIHTNDGDGATVLAVLDGALGSTPVPVVLDHFGRPGALGVDDPIFDTARAVGATPAVGQDQRAIPPGQPGPVASTDVAVGAGGRHRSSALGQRLAVDQPRGRGARRRMPRGDGVAGATTGTR